MARGKHSIHLSGYDVPSDVQSVYGVGEWKVRACALRVSANGESGVQQG